MIICNFSGLADWFGGLIFILKFPLRKEMEAISSPSKVRKLNWGEKGSLKRVLYRLHTGEALSVCFRHAWMVIRMYLTGMPSVQAWTGKSHPESQLLRALPKQTGSCPGLGPLSAVVHAGDDSWMCFFLGLCHHAMFPLIFFNCLGNRVNDAFRSQR